MVLLASLYVAVVAPLIELYRDREARIAVDRLMEPRLRAAAAQVPQLQARLAELRQASATRKSTLPGASDALAAAALQSEVDRLGAAAGVTLASTEALPATPRGDYRRVGLRLAISGTYAEIAKLLAAIETADPPLVVDDLQLHGKPMAAAVAAAAPVLDAGMSVFGFRAVEASAKP